MLFGMHGCKPLCEFADFKVEETDKGIRLEITPKDAKKAKAFKAMVMAHQDLCDCE